MSTDPGQSQVRRCLYGVDRNPLSVELCKAALWIEAIEPGKPLGFLDAHIKCGDSLIGVADPAVLRSGIPDEAFKELTGDDKGHARDLRKWDKGERDTPDPSLLPEVAMPPGLAAAVAALTDAPEDTLDAVEGKRRATAMADRIGIECLAKSLQEKAPMTTEDREIVLAHLDAPLEAARLLLARRRPRWLTGWRDICRATDERTVIAAATPVSGTGDTLLLMFPKQPAILCAALTASLCSLVGDYVARQKIGGTHLKHHVFKQLCAPPPSSYTAPTLGFLLPRILELTYTAEDMRPWAEDLDHDGPLFGWDEVRRAHLRADLDAAYAHLYGPTRDDLRYILDPTSTRGSDFPPGDLPRLEGEGNQASTTASTAPPASSSPRGIG